MKTEESLVGHEIQVQIKVEEIRPSHGKRISEDDEKEDEKKDDKKKDKERSDKQEVVVSVVKDLNVKFVNQSLVLFFGETSPLFFKPGLSYVGHVRSIQNYHNLILFKHLFHIYSILVEIKTIKFLN